MAMEFGMTIRKLNAILGAIEWIKKRDLEFINGSESSAIKESLDKTIEKAMEGFISFHPSFKAIQLGKAKVLNKK
jgi:heptaprenylglyceryl phosphate synthase